MASELDKESMRRAYDEVRDDSTDTAWTVFKYEGNKIIVDSSGTEYNEFQEKFSDGERAFGYVRLITGDEMSKRAKFVLIMWIGGGVSPLQRARVSTDGSQVKSVVRSFALEIQASEVEDIEEKSVLDQVVKVGGANYGTGERKSISK